MSVCGAAFLDSLASRELHLFFSFVFARVEDEELLLFGHCFSFLYGWLLRSRGLWPLTLVLAHFCHTHTHATLPFSTLHSTPCNFLAPWPETRWKAGRLLLPFAFLTLIKQLHCISSESGSRCIRRSQLDFWVIWAPPSHVNSWVKGGIYACLSFSYRNHVGCMCICQLPSARPRCWQPSGSCYSLGASA